MDRLHRWRDRIRGLVESALSDKVSHEVRLAIEDYVAVALGEASGVIEKGKTQLAGTYARADFAKPGDRAYGFRRAWLDPRPFMRGLLAVRHHDVHFEARYSGRMVQIQPAGTRPFVRVWWTAPSLSEEQNAELFPQSQLAGDELESFTHRLLETDLLVVLDDLVRDVGDFQAALARELHEVARSRGE